MLGQPNGSSDDANAAGNSWCYHNRERSCVENASWGYIVSETATAGDSSLKSQKREDGTLAASKTCEVSFAPTSTARRKAEGMAGTNCELESKGTPRSHLAAFGRNIFLYWYVSGSLSATCPAASHLCLESSGIERFMWTRPFICRSTKWGPVSNTWSALVEIEGVDLCEHCGTEGLYICIYFLRCHVLGHKKSEPGNNGHHPLDVLCVDRYVDNCSVFSFLQTCCFVLS